MDPHSGSGATIAQGETEYFAVSPRKFASMSVVTFGLYELYWAYKQWVVIRDKTGESLWPFWRAVFAPLWAFSLFKRVRVIAEQRGITVGWTGDSLAAAYFILNLSWKLPNPFWLVDVATFLPVLPVISTIEDINNAPPHLRNDSFSGANMAAIVLGGLFWAMIVLGLFLPDTA